MKKLLFILIFLSVRAYSLSVTVTNYIISDRYENPLVGYTNASSVVKQAQGYNGYWGSQTKSCSLVSDGWLYSGVFEAWPAYRWVIVSQSNTIEHAYYDLPVQWSGQSELSVLSVTFGGAVSVPEYHSSVTVSASGDHVFQSSHVISEDDVYKFAWVRLNGMTYYRQFHLDSTDNNGNEFYSADLVNYISDSPPPPVPPPEPPSPPVPPSEPSPPTEPPPPDNQNTALTADDIANAVRYALSSQGLSDYQIGLAVEYALHSYDVSGAVHRALAAQGLSSYEFYNAMQTALKEQGVSGVRTAVEAVDTSIGASIIANGENTEIVRSAVESVGTVVDNRLFAMHGDQTDWHVYNATRQAAFDNWSGVSAHEFSGGLSLNQQFDRIVSALEGESDPPPASSPDVIDTDPNEGLPAPDSSGGMTERLDSSETMANDTRLAVVDSISSWVSIQFPEISGRKLNWEIVVGSYSWTIDLQPYATEIEMIRTLQGWLLTCVFVFCLMAVTRKGIA